MGAHVRRTAEKANKALAAIGRLIPKARGPREATRKILCSVVHSIMLCAAPIWHKALQREVNRKVLLSTQCRTAIYITEEYRTASTRPLLVVARIPLIHIWARQRMEERSTEKTNANTTMFERWQEWWQGETDTEQWTRRLIPDIAPWFSRKHGDTTYHLTQLLTGHGCFQIYRKRFHMASKKQEVETVTGQLTPDNIINKMLEDAEIWTKISSLAKYIIDTKERDIRV
nr:uncharacterized protein LOC111507931 [Leptinotarsa decemlineata]